MSSPGKRSLLDLLGARTLGECHRDSELVKMVSIRSHSLTNLLTIAGLAHSLNITYSLAHLGSIIKTFN